METWTDVKIFRVFPGHQQKVSDALSLYKRKICFVKITFSGIIIRPSEVNIDLGPSLTIASGNIRF